MKKIQNDLKQLISLSVKTLGQAISDVHGKALFNKIEALRKKMKHVRGKEAALVQKTLEDVYKDLNRSNDEEVHNIAKAFSLMLELINSCESAYRIHRLKDYKLSTTHKPQSLIYVFTGHPTESRSQNFLHLMKKVETLLSEALESDFSQIKERLIYLLRLAVRVNLANNRRPKVKDEMEQIFHTVLDKDILMEQVSLKKLGVNVLFRTWVGGDKDGHPGVGPATLLESLCLSRKKILAILTDKFHKFNKEIELIGVDEKFKMALRNLDLSLVSLKKVQKDDGKKIVMFNRCLKNLIICAKKKNLLSPDLSDIEQLSWLYPALVLPLEIREDSELIHKALINTKLPIGKMLSTLKSISNGFEAKWYVRGFVISMCQEPRDLLAAAQLTKKVLKKYSIPVVPLFENEKGLTNSILILSDSFKKFPFLSEHKRQWGGRFEVMLGYSDSSKENGVLPARLMVEKGILEIDKYLLKCKLKPVFFHGSGGSTSRGGGPVQDQIAWWPESALKIFKVTIQGEMVQRNFTSPFIMRSQVGKIIDGYSSFKPKKNKYSKDLGALTNSIQEEYRKLVHDLSFQDLVSSATPYDYLSFLKIGSRPSKRAGKGNFSLRAIPWILCWTQTRLLLPVWWGTGTAWKNLSKNQKRMIKKDYAHSPLLQSYVKNLGFTLAKTELGVWNFHLENSRLSVEAKAYWKKVITSELRASMAFFKEISGEKNMTWFRPWLGESIIFRSSMIHPLNVIQKIALERKDRELLRETVTGIACGMLTTG